MSQSTEAGVDKFPPQGQQVLCKVVRIDQRFKKEPQFVVMEYYRNDGKTHMDEAGWCISNSKEDFWGYRVVAWSLLTSDILKWNNL